MVARGFAPEAIQQVLNAGVTAGTRIAQALLDGGETALAESKRIHDALRQTADDLKNLLGDKFYQAGIDLAQKIVDGLQAKLDELEDLLPHMTIPQLNAVLDNINNDVTGIIDMNKVPPLTPQQVIDTQIASIAGAGLTSSIRNAMLSDLPMFGVEVS